MDCEDGSSTFTRTVGNAGSSWTSGSGNATLMFCIVDGGLFALNNRNYGVLSLHSGYLYSKVSKYWRHFDNEDGGNENHWYGGTNSAGDGKSSQGRDTELIFDLFQANKTPTNSDGYYPNLGISYGVLGSKPDGSYTGVIWTNDEDASNANQVAYVLNPVSSFTNDVKDYTNPNYNLMVCTSNTGIIINQVK